MTREVTILITLVAYKLALITIGIVAQRRTRDGVDYFLGGRRLGPWVAAVSASASSSSAWTLLGVSGITYATGLSALWLFPSCVGGFVLNWFVVAPRLRALSHEQGSVTLTEVLAAPARSRPRLHFVIVALASTIIVSSLGLYVSTQYQAAGKAFDEVFGLAFTPSVLIGGAIVLVYTLLGGFWAVSLTDTLQGLLMAATAVVLPVAALLKIGGIGGLWEGLQQVPVGGFLDFTGNHTGLAAVGFVLGFLGIGLGYPGQPHVVNRFMALEKGERSLRLARRIAVGWALVVYSGMIILGLCGRVLFHDLPDPETVFFVATGQLFPPVISGIMIAAVLSAVMSTADSQLLVAAAAVTHDLKLGGKTSASMLSRSRLVVLIVGSAAILVAVYGNPEIFSKVLSAWSIMAASFGPLLLLTLWRGSIPPGVTLLTMAVGLTLTLVGIRWLSPSPGGFAERIPPLIGALAVAGAALSLRRETRSP